MTLLNLEDVFRKACKKHPQLKLLESQWSFDKELMSKALQNVSTIFPHYSRHDASHSRQLIVNIERMLGDKIKKLSATDLWLILEAAYGHDIGMVITYEQMKELEDKEFAEYIQEVINDEENYLKEFAKEWKEGKLKLPFGVKAQDTYSKFIQLISEWYRKKHPKLSSNVIKDPLIINLKSPRTELVPKRLFNVLGDICHAHGENFDQILNKLPFSEAGMATEDCHPLYVACLIRMADLLDIDDNRFCPVMMSMVSEKLPRISKAHYNKHQSIKHFRIDTSKIKIEVECPDFESYEVAFEWFKWLQGEHNNQTQHWDKIVPHKKMGSLPILISPKVAIKYPLINLDEGKKPEFSADRDAILDLVRGTGLYSSKFDSIREILQNAVDATLIALWEKNKDKINNKKEDFTPDRKELYDIFNDYEIKIGLEKISESNTCTIKIIDKGIGIGKDDLKYILNIGSANKNKKKTKVTKEMPKWLQPSGCFGIGMQSIFLLTDKFTICTKTKDSEALKLTFSKEKNDIVNIEALGKGVIEEGTSIEFNIILDKIPNSINLDYMYPKSLFSETLYGYDFTGKNSTLVDYDYLILLSQIISFSKKSFIKILIEDNKFGSEYFVNRYINTNNYYDEKNDILLSDIKFQSLDSMKDIKTYFRGQLFKDLNLAFGYISCSFDFYGYKAIDFLTYNREKILSNKKEEVIGKLLDSISYYIDKKFDSLSNDEKCYAAAFYILLVASRGNNVFKNKEIFENLVLENYKISINDKKILLKDLIASIFNKEKIRFITQRKQEKIKINDETLYELTSSRDDLEWGLITYFTKEKMYFQVSSKDDYYPYQEIYTFYDENTQPFDNDYVKAVLLQQKVSYYDIGARILFPVWGKFRSLAINTNIPYARIVRYNCYKCDGVLVLPGIFNITNKNKKPELNLDDDLLNWVYEHRANEVVTKDEIKDLYDDLIIHLNNILNSEE